MRRTRRKTHHRRQTVRVVDGQVQKKNRWDTYVKTYPRRTATGAISIVREPAMRGYRNIVSADDLHTFIQIIPKWKGYSRGLECIVLGDGDDHCFGWAGDRVICINAWKTHRAFEQVWDTKFYLEHEHILERLMVPCVIDESPGDTRCRFTRETACAFQLMHVFLHELGHHVDRMSTRYHRGCPRGEDFAERFADNVAERMWTDYFRAFRL